MTSTIRLLLHSFMLLFLFTQCALHGKYVPLDCTTDNPYHNTSSEYMEYYAVGDSIPQRAYIPTPNIRPFYDTIEFKGVNKVQALRRTSGVGSCCAPVIYPVVGRYEVLQDTLVVQFARYLIQGDTLYPLHRGSIYVKE